jgi:hypothetical protein
MAPKSLTAAEYWQRAEAFGDDFNGSPCMCLPLKPCADGYQRLTVNGKRVAATRFLYEALIGPIPPGMHLDHMCDTTNGLRSCVNVYDHLKPVTPRANTLRGRSPTAIAARKTHCKNGHPLSGDNLQITPSNAGGKPARRCVACRRANKRQRAREHYQEIYTPEYRARCNARHRARYAAKKAAERAATRKEVTSA